MFSVADFPAGNVSMTVYNDGVPLGKAQLQYYSNMEEITSLLSRVADPVDFMCQVEPLKVFHVTKYSRFSCYITLQQSYI